MNKWMPEIGAVIAVCLPQEIVRGEVKEYINEDTLDVVLNVQPPLGKAHNYRFKQTVRLTRQKAEPTGEKWMSADAVEG